MPRQTLDRAAGTKRHPKYYIKLGEKLAAQGRTPPERAVTTRRGLTSLLRKWNRYCTEVSLDNNLHGPVPPPAHIVKTFLKWILDRYPRVRAATSLNLYWLLLKMHIVEGECRSIPDNLRRDVLHYKRRLVRKYQLRKLARTKPVLDADGLYHLLYTHWVEDTTIYRDELQRVSISTLLLLCPYTGCRPVSLFDTTQKTKERYRERDNKPERPDPYQAQFDSSSDTSDLSSDPSSDTSDSDNNVFADDRISEEELAPITYGDVRFFLIRDPSQDGSPKPHVLAAKITLRRTKGEDRKSQSSAKTFVFMRDQVPVFCILDHLLTHAKYDQAFRIQKFNDDTASIFGCIIPLHKNSVELQWNEDNIKRPIFRQPVKTNGVWGTSTTEPLKASQAPDSVRNQVFDHSSDRAANPYLDQEIRFDTQAAFLERPSDGIVQKLARQITLTADPTAPFRYTDKFSQDVALHSDVRGLVDERNKYTAELRRTFGFAKNAPSDNIVLQKKISVTARLHTLRENLRNEYLLRDRTAHFKNADTLILEAQFNDQSLVLDIALPIRSGPRKYNLSERGSVVQYLFDQIPNLTQRETQARRVMRINQMVSLCARQEAPRQWQPIAEAPEDLRLTLEAPEHPQNTFPLICSPKQCPICIGDVRKSYYERTRKFARPSSMMDHVEGHLEDRPANAPIPCHHPICMERSLVLSTLGEFKNHTQVTYGIVLRP